MTDNPPQPSRNDIAIKELFVPKSESSLQPRVSSTRPHAIPFEIEGFEPKIDRIFSIKMVKGTSILNFVKKSIKT